MKTDFVKSVADAVIAHRLISAGQHVCVCLSGGADSVSLLLALDELKNVFKFNLSAVHINHMIRGDEAYRDQQFCASLCDGLGIKLDIISINVPECMLSSGKSLEETARDCRYAAFYDLKQKTDIDLFATAHTASDNAETVLMNIIRGTTVSGLAGIPIRRDCFIRPLRMLYRTDVIDYLKSKNQNYVTDSTNLISDCTRNFVRNDVIPMLRTVGSNVDVALNRLSAVAEKDDDYINSLCGNIDAKDLSSLPFPIAFRKIKNAYNDFCGEGLSTMHVCKIIDNLGRCTKVSLPNQVQAYISHGNVTFSKKGEKVPDDGIYRLEYGQNSFAHGKTRIVFSDSAASETFAQLDLNRTVGPIRYRMRMTGDKIYCRGVNRLLKKEFINKKVPLILRDICPVFFDDEGIIYVPYIGVADRIYTKANDAKYISVSFAGRQET